MVCDYRWRGLGLLGCLGSGIGGRLRCRSCDGGGSNPLRVVMKKRSVCVFVRVVGGLVVPVG